MKLFYKNSRPASRVEECLNKRFLLAVTISAMAMATTYAQDVNINPKGSALGGIVSTTEDNIYAYGKQLDVLRLNSERVVTPYRNVNNKLSLSTWNITTGATNISLWDTQTSPGPEIEVVKAAVLSESRIVTISGTWSTTYNNKLIEVWDISSAGYIIRRGSISFGAKKEYNILKVDDDRFAVLSKSSTGFDLDITVYDVTSSGNLQQVGQTSFAANNVGYSLTGVAVNPSKMVVCYGDDATSNLVVLGVTISSSGTPTVVYVNGAYSISSVSVTRLNQLAVMTTVRQSNGKLKSIRWNVYSSGSVLRQADSGELYSDLEGAPAPDNAVIAQGSGSNGRFVTVDREWLKGIRISVYNTNSSSVDLAGNLLLSGEYAKQLRTCQLSTSSILYDQYFVTAYTNADEQLQLRTWDLSLDLDASGKTDGISTAESAVQLNVHPNPSSGIFNMELTGDDQMAQVQVMDITGKIVKQLDLNGRQSTLDLTGMKQGLYLIKVKTLTGEEKVQRLILNR
ncbi:MAG: T9SS type A sorting domain-containing protein [Flavobacteriales bacterium]|nr:T9SS type A sorting domain-containing protein [Flavobacteriales bacterium]MCB9448385.1 T9SS type A sorting domain-containing protein [Flavobacteriales bacterium]